MPSGQSLTASAARGGAVTIVAQVARTIVLLVQVVVLARVIDPGTYGLLAMVVAFTGVAVILRDFGLSTAALRSAVLTHQQRTNLFWLNTGSGFVLGATIFTLAWPISAFYQEPELVTLVQWIAPTYLLSGITAQFRVSISQALRFRALAICDVVPPLAALVLAIPVATSGHALAALIVLQVTAPAADLLLAYFLARWRPGLPRRAEGMRGLMSFGLGFAATQLLSYVSRNIDSILIGRVWGANALGFYDRAYQLSVQPVNQINTPMTKVALPVLARVVDDRERFNGGLRSAQLVALYATATVLCIAAGLSAPLIDVFLGAAWAASAPIFAVLAIGSVFRAIQQIAIWLQVAKGTAGSLLVGNLIGQPVIIVAVLCGLPWGPIGVAIGSAIGYAVFWVFSVLWAGRNTGVDTKPLLSRAFRVVLLVGAPAGLSAFVVSTLVPAPSIVLLMLGTAAAAASLVISWASSSQTRSELGTLQRFLRAGLGHVSHS
ncbi:lipopolysaccharide biosynthesis protein [Arthrobacter sp. NPDC089319]|uniref:lipopolysaccharide biosynthesis protein n=1 Tax=Arthrobacter sp. NPDC089319 TaxID=3155915 RepID=UPI00344A707C